MISSSSSSVAPEAGETSDSAPLNSSGTSGQSGDERERTLSENESQPKAEPVTSAREPRSLAKESILIMDSWYPNLWNGNCVEVETICIPACLDVNVSEDKDKRRAILGPTDPKADTYNAKEAETYKTTIQGLAGEDAFLLAFYNLKIGGLLIMGFQSKEFANKQLMKDAFRDVSEFEVDAIYVHPRLGMVFLEIKAVEKKSKHKVEWRANAVKQLLKFRQEIPALWTLLCGSDISIDRIPLYFALCFPNATLGDSNSPDEKDLIRIDNSHFLNPVEMKNVFTDKMTASLSEEELSALKSFACQIAAYRSGEFTSLFQNAMKVHGLVDQLFMWAPKQTAVIKKCKKLWLTEKTVHHQLILGWLGTGKTLLIQELSLELAKGGEIVCIVAPTAPLRKKYEMFFEKNIENKGDRPVIVDGKKKVNDEKYIFVDEEPGSCKACFALGVVDLQDWLKSLLPHQSAFVIVNGADQLHPFAGYSSVFLSNFEKKLPNYECEFFDTILRSSKQVYERYRPHYEHCLKISNRHMCLGHNVSGPCVNEQTSTDIADSLDRARSIIEELRAQATSANELHRQPSNDFAQMLIIIPENLLITNETGEATYRQLMRFISEKQNIPCGSIIDQMESNKVALVLADMGERVKDMLSMEWPIVIVIWLSYRPKFVPPDRLILWYTRCTSKLFIIRQAQPSTLPPSATDLESSQSES